MQTFDTLYLVLIPKSETYLSGEIFVDKETAMIHCEEQVKKNKGFAPYVSFYTCRVETHYMLKYPEPPKVGE